MKKPPNRWSPLPLRLLLGIGCIHHGWHNVIMVDERQAFTWMLRDIGAGHPLLLLAVISAVSFTGGLALLTGAYVRLACIPLAVNVSAILLFIHAPSGFDFVKLTAVTVQGPQYGMPGYEVSLLYLAGLLSLFFSGAGPFSLDSRRRWRRESPVVRPAEHPFAGAWRVRGRHAVIPSVARLPEPDGRTTCALRS
jgi:putative oxidoreductase